MAITTSFKVFVESEFDKFHNKLKDWQPNISYYDLKKELEELEEDIMHLLSQTHRITELEEAEDEGYERGREDGYDEGKNDGYDDGYENGYKEAMEKINE
jgi:flagellar biosynthesis/type III secretory pathway protein FliH